MPTPEFNSNERFLRARDVRTRYSISDPSLYRWVEKGDIPPPEYLNGQRVWRESVLLKAEERMLASNQRVETRMGA